MQPSDFMMEAQQQIVGDGKERAFQRGENRKFILRPFDGGEGGAQRFHFFAAMKRFRSNQQVRDLAGFQASNIIASNVFTEIGEAAKQQANVPRRNRQKLFRIFGIAHFPAAFAHQPFDERHDGFGQAGVDGRAGDSHGSIRPGCGQRNDAGLLGKGRGFSLQRGIRGLAGSSIVLHFRFKRRVNQLLDRTQRPKAGGQLNHAHAALLQRIANFPVQHHVGTAELIDRLLRIADHEQLPRFGRDLQPVRFAGIVRGEQQQDLGLQRIGILKLVDENVSEAVLQIAADIRLVAHQVARQEQQVHKVELAGAPLQLIVMDHQFPHFAAKNCSEVGIGGVLEGFQLIQQMLAGLHHLFARNAFGEEPGTLLRVLLDIANQLDEEAFERIIIARAGRFRALDPGDQRLGGPQRLHQIVVAFCAARGRFSDQLHLFASRSISASRWNSTVRQGAGWSRHSISFQAAYCSCSIGEAPS